MSFRLSASNIGWAQEDDGRVYAHMKELGFSGLEIAPTRIFPEKPYEQPEAAAQFAAGLRQEYGFTIPSMQSIWFGKSGSIYQPEQAAELESYTEAAFDFANAVGCRSLVFGNPRQRNLPEGHTAAEAEAFLNRLGQMAARKGVKLALEANPPIYNTNYLNTTRQALDTVKRLENPGLSVNLDVGTMIANQENPEDFADDLPLVSHVHISEPGLAPIQPRPLHRRLAQLLAQAGYQGFVSLEMRTGDYDTVNQCLTYLAEVFA